MSPTRSLAFAGLISLISATAEIKLAGSGTLEPRAAASVAPLWSQCGGYGLTGLLACAAGSTCVQTSSDWWNCQPSISSSTIAITSTSSKSTSSSSKPVTSITSKSTSPSSLPVTSSSIKITPSSSTSTVSTTTSSAPIAYVSPYGQCGGQSYTGSLTCVKGWTCKVSNQFFSQCLPDTSISTPIPTYSPTTTYTAPPKQTYNYLVTFGDSYSQTGFDITGTKPTLDNQMGNPSFPGYTTSGGANWIGRIISENLGTVSYNFASGGATTDASLVTPYASTVLSLVDQVALFSSNLSPPPSYAPWVANNTLFAIWIGVNDVGNAWYSSSWPTLSQQIVNRYFEQVAIIYKAGGRNFAFLNVPPIQRAPVNLVQTAADQASIATAIGQYNALIQSASDAFSKNNPGSTTIVVDTQNPFNVILDSPTTYGAPNASCFNADGTSCLWWNNYHPGLKIQQLVGDTVAVDVGFYL